MKTAFALAILLSGIGVLGDYYLRIASSSNYPLRTRAFLAGITLFAGSAFGWVYVMKHLKLATIGLVYSVSTAVLLAVVGVFLFDETLNWGELCGIALGLTSIVLLARFT